MSQSTIIAGVILFAFIVYITMKGELPKYLAVLGLQPSTVTTSTASSTGYNFGNINTSQGPLIGGAVSLAAN